MGKMVRQFILVSAQNRPVPGGLHPSLTTSHVEGPSLVEAIQSFGIFSNKIGEVYNFSRQASLGDRLTLTRGHVSVVIFRVKATDGCLKDNGEKDQAR